MAQTRLRASLHYSNEEELALAQQVQMRIGGLDIHTLYQTLIDETTPKQIIADTQAIHALELAGGKMFEQYQVSSNGVWTLADAIKVAQVDTSEWQIKSFRTNPYKPGFCQVRIEWEPRQFDESLVIQKTLERLGNFAMPHIPFANPEQGEIAVLSLYDAHLDKLPCRSVNGTVATVEDNISSFMDGASKLIARASERKVSHIILPIGNDLYHTDNFSSATTKGTPLEYYTSAEDAYALINDAVIKLIAAAAQIAPVTVVIVPSNHDNTKVKMLGYWLDRLFSSTDHVNVVNEATQRQYLLAGKNLFMFAHGDKEKPEMIPSMMIQERPLDFVTATYRKAMLGDKHHAKKFMPLVIKDSMGVVVEYLRTTNVWDDKWHLEYGWIGVPRSAYLHYYSPDGGETGSDIHNFLVHSLAVSK